VTWWRCAILSLALLTGCAGYASYAPVIDSAMTGGDYEAALQAVEKIDKGKSELLYCYERGTVLRAQGKYAESNLAFERADALIEELYTRSVTREVAAIAVSETIAKYRGDSFEAVLANYYRLLNYLDMRDVAGALVECRRLNHKLQILRDAGETFVDDPFLQYLTALVYEMGNEPGSAEVSYRTALGGYAKGINGAGAPPPWLACDAAANLRRQGDGAGALAYDSLGACPAPESGTGRVFVLIETGRVLRKLQNDIVLPILETDRWDNNERYAHELAKRRGQNYESVKVKYWLRVSLPSLEPRPPQVLHAVVRATPRGDERGAQLDVPGVPVEDFDRYAAAAFKEKEGTVLVRAIVRGIGKYTATQQASEKDEGLGAVVNILGAITETADTRSWTTLPSSVMMARVNLPPGIWRLDAEVMDANGLCIYRLAFGEVDVRAGGTDILTARAL